MRTAISTLSLRQPASLGEALDMLRNESLTPLAGATDLYVTLNFGTLSTNRFIDISRLTPLREITESDGLLRIGALATYTSIINAPLVQARLPMLVEAARVVGGAQIQNRGTLGGNIANGSPAGDTLPVLAAAEAKVVLLSAGGERRVAFADYYTGYRTSVRRDDELIAAVEVAHIQGRQWFRKVGTRAAQAISKVVMAGVRAPMPRLALGSVAATVIRLTATEHALASGSSIDDAAKVLQDEITPLDDVRSTAEYRRRVSANLLRRFWRDTA
ncbi:MAG: FAD binding domain-containing protein [Gemmatimonadaceae bacterium]